MFSRKEVLMSKKGGAKKPLSAFVSVFGDKDGSVIKQLELLKKEGRIPTDVRILHVTGFSEGSVGFLQDEQNQVLSMKGYGVMPAAVPVSQAQVTWPNVSAYQKK
jgi:hypothetical protein